MSSGGGAPSLPEAAAETAHRFEAGGLSTTGSQQQHEDAPPVTPQERQWLSPPQGIPHGTRSTLTSSNLNLDGEAVEAGLLASNELRSDAALSVRRNSFEQRERIAALHTKLYKDADEEDVVFWFNDFPAATYRVPWVGRLGYVWAHAWAAIALCLVTGALLNGFESGRLPYIDTLFTSVSAFTNTGLLTFGLSGLNPASQVLLMALMQSGSMILGTMPFCYLRRAYLQRELRSKPDLSEATQSILRNEAAAFGWLAVIVPAYMLAVQFAGFLVLGAYAAARLPAVRGRAWWWALFLSVGAFNNAGMSIELNPDGTLFADSTVALAFSVLVFLGNTWSPIVIRAICVVLARIVPPAHRRPFEHILNVSHIYYSHVYSKLLATLLVGLNVVILAVSAGIFLGIEWHRPLLEDLSPWQRVTTSIELVAAARSAGTATVPLAALSGAAQMMYLLLMYLPAQPLLSASGVQGNEPHEVMAAAKQQYRQLMHSNITWLCVSVMLVCFFEVDAADSTTSNFAIVFEIVSAFGNSGMSLGHTAYAFESYSVSLSSPSKLVIMFCMILGRHRDLRSYLEVLASIEAGAIEAANRPSNYGVSPDVEAAPSPRPAPPASAAPRRALFRSQSMAQPTPAAGEAANSGHSIRGSSGGAAKFFYGAHRAAGGAIRHGLGVLASSFAIRPVDALRTALGGWGVTAGTAGANGPHTPAEGTTGPAPVVPVPLMTPVPPLRAPPRGRGHARSASAAQADLDASVPEGEEAKPGGSAVGHSAVSPSAVGQSPRRLAVPRSLSHGALLGRGEQRREMELTPWGGMHGDMGDQIPPVSERQ